jgi:Protein of unknown function (DUF4012)
VTSTTRRPTALPTINNGASGSGRETRHIRRNRLDERVAIAIAVVSGIVASFADVEPTGSPAVDHPMVGLAVAFVTWAAASAPWWAVATTAGVAAVVAVDAALTFIGALAFLAGLWIGVRRRDLGALRAVVAAIGLNVLVRSELDGFFGSSALIGVVTGVALFLVGIRRRRRRVRRVAWAVVAVVASAAGIALIGFGVAASTARSSLLEGNRLAREGIAQIRTGDFDAAAERFAAAADALARADDDLSQPWARPAQLVPVLAQNREAVADVAASAGESCNELATALAELDPERLRLTNGRIDLTAFDTFARPLASVQATLTELRATVGDVESPWLVAPLRDRLDRLDGDIAANESPLANAITATQVVPGLLGGDGPRRYLIVFTTPAEARGLGGFMGNYAEFVADGGRLELTRFGRTGELNRGGDDPLARVVSGPEDWLQQYGRYGFANDPRGTTGAVPWSNVTMSPHFPSTARVIAELYPQSGGSRLDGVFAMDPYVLAALVDLTGPIDVRATGETLETDEVVPFLLQEQYTIRNERRVDLLEQVARRTVDRVLGGSLPAPTELADALGGLARQGRLAAWAVDPDEQELFERVGLSGALPELAGGDGVAVVVNNAAANKIDVYLEREVRYRATVDLATGQATGTVDVTLTNTATAEGLPPVVVGNAVGEPAGTNRSLVSVYTALPVVSASRDGEPLVIETGREQGWITSRALVTIPPGASTTVTLDLAGPLDIPDGYSLSTRPQPLVAPERHDIVVTSAEGEQLAVFNSVATERRRLDSEDS